MIPPQKGRRTPPVLYIPRMIRKTVWGSTMFLLPSGQDKTADLRRARLYKSAAAGKPPPHRKTGRGPIAGKQAAGCARGQNAQPGRKAAAVIRAMPARGRVRGERLTDRTQGAREPDTGARPGEYGNSASGEPEPAPGAGGRRICCSCGFARRFSGCACRPDSCFAARRPSFRRVGGRMPAPGQTGASRPGG